MLKYLKIISINLLLILSFLALGEVFLRVYFIFNSDYNVEMWRYGANLKQATENPKLPFEHKKNASGNFYGVNITTNEYGFRDDDQYEIERKENVKRVMVLGDSFTLGWGVAFDKIFSKQLQKN